MKQKTVMAFGVFDLLHPGHIRFLHRAKRLGDRLVVVVARDTQVARQKGKRPILSQDERKEMVASLSMVDEAVLGDAGPPSIIRRRKPAVIAVGYDQDERHPMLLAQLLHLKRHPRVVKIPAFEPKRFHSSLLKLHARH